jgi:hypothetical protein
MVLASAERDRAAIRELRGRPLGGLAALPAILSDRHQIQSRFLQTGNPEKVAKDQTMTSYDDLAYVEAELNYLAPVAERPRYYAYDPEPGVLPSNIAHEAHRVRIHDMRPIQSQIALDRQGFALLEQRSAVRDFWDEDEISRVYYPEAERFIAAATGASRVFIFDHTLRRRIPGAVDRSRDAPRQPATRVHVDHTAKSGPQRVRDCWAGRPRNCCAAASR